MQTHSGLCGWLVVPVSIGLFYDTPLFTCSLQAVLLQPQKSLSENILMRYMVYYTKKSKLTLYNL